MRTLPAVCIFLAAFMSAAAYAGDSVVARVGSEPITRLEVAEVLAMNPNIDRQGALDFLIESRLILTWAVERGIRVSGQEIEQAEASIRDRNSMTREEFEKVLAQQGETLESFRETLREQITIRKAVDRAMAARMQVTNSELQDHYLAVYPSRTVYEVSHILLAADKDAAPEEEASAREKAGKILEEIRAGAAFEDMASKYSQDKTSSGEGGFLGAFSEGELLPGLEELAAALEPGESGGPVRTPAGYHILKLVSKERSEPPPLAEVRGQLERELMARKEKSVRDQWLDELKETTYIEVFPDDG